MMPGPLKCGEKLAGGMVCQEDAIVTTVRYTYDREPTIGGGVGDYVLKAIHYKAVCPNCGEREIADDVE